MKHVNRRHRLRQRVAPAVAVALAAGGLVALGASAGSAATPSSGERIVSWKRVADTATTGHIERAADVAAPSGERFVDVIANGGGADGFLALTDQHHVVVGGTAQIPVPQAVLDASVVDIDTDASTVAFTAVTASGTVHAWNNAGTVTSPVSTCAARSATTNNLVVAVVCRSGSVEFLPMPGETVPSYYDAPSDLSGVTDVTLANMKIGTTANANVAIAINGAGEAVRWGQGVTGHDAPPRTSGKTMAALESRNGLTTAGAVVSFSDAPRHDIAIEDGGLDPAVNAAGLVSVSSSTVLGFGITSSGTFTAWGDNGSGPLLQVLRSLPSGLANEHFVAVSGNSNRVAVIVADSAAPSGPQVGSPSTIAGATGGVVAPGSTLTGIPATFTGPAVTTTTDWLVDGAVIASAAGSLTLTVTPAMVDKGITFRTRATGGGLASPLDSVSPSVAVVGAVPHTVVTPSTVSGSPAAGLYLTGTPATYDTAPDTVSTRWLADGTEIPDTRNLDSIMLTENEVGKKVTFSTRASWDADDGAAPTVSTSEPTAPIRVELKGTAVIKGDPVVGSTLKLAIDWTDDSPDVALTGDWLHTDDFLPITGAAGATYTLTKADIGRNVVWVGYGSRYADEMAYPDIDFAGVGPVTAAQLTITGRPTISGSPYVGGTLTAAPAAVNDDEADVTLHWLVGGDDTGETGTTYTPTTADLGKKVTVEQTASRDGATSGLDFASAGSAATAAVSERPADLAVESAAAVSGTPLEGRTLTGTPATFSPTDDVTVSSYWVVDGVQGAAGGTTLTLTGDHVGKSIQFRSVATRGDDTLSSTSTSVGPVIAKLSSTAKPRVEGTPTVGQSLTGIPGGFSASEGVSVSSYWVVDGEQSAADGALALTEDHVGKTIAFRSVATRGDETVTSTSEAVGPVTKPEPPQPRADVKVLLDGPTTPGATIGVRVGKDFAGDTVSVSTTDPKRDLGDEVVDAEGNISVTVPADMPLGNQTLTVHKGSTVLGSDAYAVTLTRPDGDAGKDRITVSPGTVKAGEPVVITVGVDHAGEQVRIVAFSSPTGIGFQTVAANGTVTVTIPASLGVGEHRMAVYGDDARLIGYDDFTVVATPGSDGSTPGGRAPGDGTPLGNPPLGGAPGSGGSPGSDGALPSTGNDLPQHAAAIGLLMVLVGFAMVSVGGGRRPGGRRRA
jgi:hypothetical protein